MTIKKKLGQNGGGKKPHVPTIKTRGKVIEFICSGFGQKDIAMYFDINEDTLRKYYREELDKAHIHRTSKLGGKLYKQALGGDFKSQEFWLRTQGRWANAKPKEDIERDNKIDSLLETLVGQVKSKSKKK